MTPRPEHRLNGTMTYDQMLTELLGFYGLEFRHASDLNRRWKSMGKGARSVTWAIGSKYV